MRPSYSQRIFPSRVLSTLVSSGHENVPTNCFHHRACIASLTTHPALSLRPDLISRLPRILILPPSSLPLLKSLNNFTAFFPSPLLLDREAVNIDVGEREGGREEEVRRKVDLLTSLLRGGRPESCCDAALRSPERREEEADGEGFVDDDRWVTVVLSAIRILACFVTMVVTTVVWAVVLIVMLPWPYQRIRQGNYYGHVTGRLMMWILGNPLRIEGSEFSNTRAIFICNHASPIGIFLVMWLTPIGTVGIAKKEIIWYPLFGQLYVLANHLRIDRSNPTAAIESLKEAARAISENNLSLIIFPEGTRSRTGRLLRFKKGFMHMALETRLPIVPMVVTGAHLACRKNSLRVRPAPITVKYLPPIETDGWKAENMNEYIEMIHSLYVENLPESQKPPTISECA